MTRLSKSATYGAAFTTWSRLTLFFVLLWFAGGLGAREAKGADQVDEAISFLAAGNLEIGIKRLNSAIESKNLSSPRLFAALYARGEAERRLSRFDEALADLTACLQFSESIAVRNVRALVYHDLGDFQSEIYDLTRILQSTPNDLNIRLRRGAALSNSPMPDLAMALADFDFVLKEDNKNIFALTNRAYVRITQKKFGEALRDIETAEKISPVDPAVIFRRADYFVQTQKLDLALPLFANLVKFYDSNPAYIFPYVVLLRRVGHFGEANTICDAMLVTEKYRVVGSAKSDALAVCAQVAMDQGHYMEAVQKLSTAIASSKAARSDLLSLRGNAYALAAQYPAALSDLDLAIATNPGVPAAFLLRGMLRWHQGSTVDARRDFQFAVPIGIEPDRSVALLWLAIAAEPNLARDIRKIAKALPPDAPKLWPWPLAEVIAGLATLPQLLAVDASKTALERDYERGCSIPFFMAATERTRTSTKKFDRAAYGATMRQLITACPPGSIENLGARLEAAQFPPP